MAKRDIAVGELIALDTPYAAMLDKEEVRTLCWNCFKKLESPVPCPRCSGVLFCGSKCGSAFFLNTDEFIETFG